MNTQYAKHLLRHGLIYGTGEALYKAVGFILIPLYTRHLSTDEYGVLQILLITTTFVSIFTQMGFGSSIIKAVMHKEDLDARVAFSTAFCSILAISLVLVAALFHFAGALSVTLTENGAYAYALKLLFGSVILKNLSVLPLAKLRMDDRSTLYSGISFLRFLLQLGLTIYLVAFEKQGIIGIILADLIVAGLFSLVFINLVLSELILVFSFRALRDMLAYGLPLVPAAVAMFVLNASDRYFLKHYSTLEEVGLYSLGYRIGFVMAVIVTAFQQVWGTTMFKVAKEKEATTVFKVLFTYFILVLTQSALGLSIFAADIIRLLASPEFYSSYEVVPLIALSYIFYGIYYFTAIGVNIKQKTAYQAFVVILAGLLNVILNYLLIPGFGMTGAALATATSFLFMAIAAAAVSQRLYPIRFEYSRITILAFSACILFCCGFYIPIENSLASIGFKIAVCLGYPVLLHIFGFFTVRERARIKSFLNSMAPAIVKGG